MGPAETGSLYYGLLVHFPLLSTPAYADAVTFSYRPECAYLKRTRTSRTKHAYRRTRTGLLTRLKAANATAWESRPTKLILDAFLVPF
jgi:hypothetical protein